MATLCELNGTWYGNTSDVVAKVDEQTVYWPHGLTSQLEPTGKNFQMMLRGQVVDGQVNPDGSIQWMDGDVWRRVDEVDCQNWQQVETVASESGLSIGTDESSSKAEFPVTVSPCVSLDSFQLKASKEALLKCANGVPELSEVEIREGVRRSLMNPLKQAPGDTALEPSNTIFSAASINSAPSRNQASQRIGARDGKQTLPITNRHRSCSASPRAAVRGSVDRIIKSSSPVSNNGVSKETFRSGSSGWAKTTGREIGEKFQSTLSNSASPRNLVMPSSIGNSNGVGIFLPSAVNSSGLQLKAQPSLFSNVSSATRTKSPPRIGALADTPQAPSTVRSSDSPRSLTKREASVREQSVERVPMHHRSRATHNAISLVTYTSGSSPWAKSAGREIGDQFVSKLHRGLEGQFSPRSRADSPSVYGTNNHSFGPMSQMGSAIRDSSVSGRNQITPRREATMSPRVRSS
eukprot:GEMP01033093.1.p1 GENE.GEMP01033093.1~~GEMP01033093.1.p1  ORF type:complete len:463 (+),score=82.46 GEMP01033093.1:78-1466(+)